jgi:nucleotide-binding universal stress UspA family protein
MRKVLIPTDFSENAMNAISYAMELFKYERSEFLIVHAYADEVYENKTELSREYFEEYKTKVGEQSDKALQKIVAKMLAISPNPKHEYIYLSVFGSLIDAANDLVDKENMDVLVMGTRGETDDRDITFGSNTLQVIKYVKCPVLAIPSSYHDLQPKNILFPTDYQLPYQRREIKLLSTMAKRFVATINFLYVSNFKNLSFRQEDNKSLLTSFLEDNKTTFIQIAGKNVTEQVNTYLEEHEVDMLVMVNTRHSYLENILYTSAIQKIGLAIRIPFLVLQNLPRY